MGNGKVRCTVTGHELLPDLVALQAYWTGKSYRKKKALHGYDFEKHAPWLVPHKKNPHLLYCTLTKRPVSKQPKAVEGHVNGLRFLKLKRDEKLRQKMEKAKAKQAACQRSTSENGDVSTSADGGERADDDDWELLEDEMGAVTGEGIDGEGDIGEHSEEVDGEGEDDDGGQGESAEEPEQPRRPRKANPSPVVASVADEREGDGVFWVHGRQRMQSGSKRSGVRKSQPPQSAPNAATVKGRGERNGVVPNTKRSMHQKASKGITKVVRKA